MANASALANARDDVVYSNLAYVAPAMVAPDWTTACVLMVTGAALVGGSSVYHATYTREGQSLDVSAMMTYIAALACAVAAQWTVWAWAALPVAALGYWAFPWEINSSIHLPLWAGAVGVMLAFQAGWWALLPIGLFAGAGAVELSNSGVDTWLHSVWHILGGLAGAAAMWVL